MTTLYIDRKGAEIDVEGDTVVVRTDGERRDGDKLTGTRGRLSDNLEKLPLDRAWTCGSGSPLE